MFHFNDVNFRLSEFISLMATFLLQITVSFLTAWTLPFVNLSGILQSLLTVEIPQC